MGFQNLSTILSMAAHTNKGAQGSLAPVDPMRFRPNLVISGGEPYAEDGWKNLRIGHNYFTVSCHNSMYKIQGRELY